MRTLDATGKSVDEAIFNGLRELAISIDEVEIEIIQQETKGILGIGGKLSDAESKLFSKWTQDFGFGEQMLKKAYDATTMQLGGKRSYDYMDGILTRWYEAGIFSPADADAEAERFKAVQADKSAQAEKGAPKRERRKEAPRYGTFDTMDAFQRALERSYGETESENKD